MPITEILERNCKLYGDEICLVELNPEIRETHRKTWKEFNLIEPSTYCLLYTSYALVKNKCTVLGDIGCYTLAAAAPLNAIEMTLCMGASVSSIHGFNKAMGAEGEKRTVAVIGDSTFMHSGMTGLANIAYNQSNSTVIIPVSYTHLRF